MTLNCVSLQGWLNDWMRALIDMKYEILMKTEIELEKTEQETSSDGKEKKKTGKKKTYDIRHEMKITLNNDENENSTWEEDIQLHTSTLALIERQPQWRQTNCSVTLFYVIANVTLSISWQRRDLKFEHSVFTEKLYFVHSRTLTGVI